MNSSFFAHRPVFAWVIALGILLAGLIALRSLPIEQYPTIAPPAVAISASYPGASAKTVEDSVTQIIEQNMTGLDHLLYMSSQSDSAGRVSVACVKTATRVSRHSSRPMKYGEFAPRPTCTAARHCAAFHVEANSSGLT